MSQKWVFEALVQNEKDGIGLIAYALYKHKKHVLAQSLRSNGEAEHYIQDQVKIFHDQTLQNNSLNDYRIKAEQYLSEVYGQLENDIKSKYEEKEKQLKQAHETRETQTKKECEAKIKKEKREFIKSVQEYERSNKSFLSIFLAWLISGIPGVIASFIITAFVIGSTVLLVPQEKRKEVFASLAAEYIGIENKQPKAK
ncbi:hypothetical protein [Pseudomonas mosselii]|uniref:Uncharacterized protein n=1 Tax=Pseudomonas mosselii TaxID=78327 RepID=A0ABX9AZ16_9PSED|nr:hypothetical protein [Pseudomonas mosselii]QZP26311.1 hypothetical protein K5H97_26605 [Pseudomonas mosselii]